MAQHVRAEDVSAAERIVYCSGDWTSATATDLEAELSALKDGAGQRSTRVNIEGVERLDTFGAWLLTKFRRQTDTGDNKSVLEGGSAQHVMLLERVEASDTTPPKRARKNSWLTQPFVSFGKVVIGSFQDMVAGNAVQGRIIAALGRTAIFQAPLRFPAFVNQFEQIVLRAIPIVALISLVVGAIITQQTILQLRNFGAVILVVDLAAILMFREIGVLLAAIMVAGRSGSAITAELGAMRIREEYDALTVMGVDPSQALLLPRVVALVIGLPFLAFIGSLAGLVGAAITARFYGDISFTVFIDRLQGSMSVTSVLVGLIKAPFMGFLVGLLASIEAMKVAGSSESLGKRTTSSVVKSIFVVIVVDGIFAIFFAAIGF